MSKAPLNNKDDYKPEFQLRHDTFSPEGHQDITLKRVAILHNGDQLRQDFTILYKGDNIGSTCWSFLIREKGAETLHLKALDRHWKALKPEFETLVLGADYYNTVKNPHPEPGENPLMLEFLRHISVPLLTQQMPDGDIAKGRYDKGIHPLTNESHRSAAMRSAALFNDMPIDPFEHRIVSIEEAVEEARVAYNRAGDNNNGLQLTAAGSEDDDYEDDKDAPWRESLDKDEDDDKWRGEGEKLAEELSYEDKAMPWRDSDDNDDDIAQNAEFIFLDFENSVADFTHAANRLWEDAANQILANEPVTRNEKELRLMRLYMDQCQETYARFREASSDMILVQDKLEPVFEVLEHPTGGPLVKMQNLVDLASNPAQLKALMEKHLNKQNDKTGEKEL